MADWRAFNTELPNSPVYDLQIHYQSQKLRAGTFGRGLWETDLATATPALSIDSFAGFVFVSWENSSFLLQQTPALSPPVWMDIATNSPLVLPVDAGHSLYFRLRR
jgi:hypothetical protein